MANTAGTNLFASVTSTVNSALTDSNGLIYFGSCTGVPPTTANLFAHGAMLVQTDSGTGNIGQWMNTGSSAVPVWNLSTAQSSINTSSSPSTTVIQNTTVTSAQLLALGTTPVTIISAPPTGQVIIVENVGFTLNAGGTAYAGGAAVKTSYTDASGVAVLTNLTSAFINTASGTSVTVVENGLSTNMTAVVNAPIVISTTTSPTAGTGTLFVSAKYRLITQS